MDDRFEDVFDPEAALGADEQSILRGDGQNVFNLLFHKFGLRGGEIYFVDDWQNGEIAGGGEKSVGDGLRFDALGGVDDKQSTFAGGERARNFVGKIDVSGSVDQVEAIGVAVLGFVVQANAFRFDGDAALTLEVHGIEDLSVHFAFGEAAGHFNEAVGECGLAVVDVRDNTEISLERWVHVPVLPAVAERKLAGCLRIFHEIRDGSIVGLSGNPGFAKYNPEPGEIAVLEQVVSHKSGLASAAEVVDEPEHEANADADDQAGDDREIKSAVFAAVDDVPGETSESQGKFWREVE